MEPQSTRCTSYTMENQSVYLLKVSKYEDDPILYFLDAGKSLRDNNKSVKVMTNNVNPSDILPVYEDLPIITSGSWIPNTIFGRLRDFLWSFRTVYTVIMSFLYIPIRDSNAVIFLDTHYVAIPILSQLTKCKVVTFQYYREYLNLKKDANTTLNENHCWALSFSDEIVVPSIMARKEFLYELDYKYPLIVTPLYPPSEVEHYPSISRTVMREFQTAITIRKYYLAIGPWHPSSEFEVTLLSFSDFYDMLDEVLKPTIQLTILGYMYPDDEEAQKYCDQVLEFLNAIECKDQISIKTNVHNEVKAVMYRISTAVLNTSIGRAFNCPMLESLYFGTPTISNLTGFPSECITTGVNGILCEGRIPDYAQSLFRMKTDTELFSCLPQDTADIYRIKYSAIVYGKNLLGIVNSFIGIYDEEILDVPQNNNKENKEPEEVVEPVVKKVKRPKIVHIEYRSHVHLR